MNLNKVIIAGRLTDNVNLRITPSGMSVASFSVATSRSIKLKNGQRDQETEFHNVVVWGSQAEASNQYLVKGSLVLIEGRLKARQWKDNQQVTRKVTEIIAESVQFGPRPQVQQTRGGYAARGSDSFDSRDQAPGNPHVSQAPNNTAEEDEIPF
jgi:single-strand DNA-binding protein